MLLLVRLDPPSGHLNHLRRLDALPAHSALPLVGAAVRCATAGETDGALRWRDAATLAAGVPLPLALVVPRDPEIARQVALEAVAPTALLFEDELTDGSCLPARVLDALWSTGALGMAEEEALRTWGAALDDADRERLRRLVRSGAAGRRAEGAAREVGTSVATLARWLAERGLPTPGALLRDARERALRHLLAAGLEVSDASRLCGWSDVRQAREFLRRGPGAGEDG